jgi:uncharacterized protein (DUF305 family)
MGHSPLSCPAIALALLGPALLGCTTLTARPAATNPLPSPTQLPAPAAAPAPTPQPPVAGFDQQFIDMMVPHHAGAVEMARIAQTRAQHAEIQVLANNILQSQSAEIDQMRGWRKAWFGTPDTPPMSRMPMVGPMNDATTMTMNTDATVNMDRQVADLRGAPEPFDAAFIEAMIPHHQMAVSAARLALQRTSHAEISDLAIGILDAQQREIGQMQAWRLQWYGSLRPNMNEPTPGSGAQPQLAPMQNMPGMMDEGH